MFDVAKLTLDEVDQEISKTIDKLEILQNMYAALMGQEHRRVKKLVEEFNALKRAEKEKEAQAEKPAIDKYIRENCTDGE